MQEIILEDHSHPLADYNPAPPKNWQASADRGQNKPEPKSCPAKKDEEDTANSVHQDWC